MRYKDPINRTLYMVWYNMRQRCYNPTVHYYERYGGRGIKVYDRWLGNDGFEHFKKDMGAKPTPQHTIERMDNDGDYSPDNCRWATPTEQNFNKHLQSNNTSGFAGVGWVAHRSKWRARITIAGVDKVLGSFDTKDEAILARKEAEKLL